MSGPARAWLEHELERVVAPRRRPHPEPMALTLTAPTTTASASASANTTHANRNVVGFYDGPALTDADVRRLERGEE